MTHFPFTYLTQGR